MEFYGEQLRAVLKHKDYKQFKFALIVNKKPQYVSALINNKKRASNKIMQQIAEKLGLSLDDLKNFDKLVQTNTEQKGGNAANFILQQDTAETECLLTLTRF